MPDKEPEIYLVIDPNSGEEIAKATELGPAMQERDNYEIETGAEAVVVKVDKDGNPDQEFVDVR